MSISLSLKQIYGHRSFIIGSVKREFQQRYQNSILGAAWGIINPLSMIFVYTVIFSQLMRAKLPGVESVFGYSIFLCSGILTWGLFSEIIGRYVNLFIDNANLLKKINFPIICLPIIALLNACVNFFIIFSLFVVFLIFTGNFPNINFLFIFPIYAVLVFFAISFGLFFGILNVFFRDVGQFVGIVLQFWFWGTPIIYPISVLPENFQFLVRFNPLTGLMEALQGVIVSSEKPTIDMLLPAFICSLVIGWLALRLYSKHVHEMVDEL